MYDDMRVMHKSHVVVDPEHAWTFLAREPGGPINIQGKLDRFGKATNATGDDVRYFRLGVEKRP